MATGWPTTGFPIIRYPIETGPPGFAVVPLPGTGFALASGAVTATVDSAVPPGSALLALLQAFSAKANMTETADINTRFIRST